MNESTENMRMLLELALSSGNKRRSAQTGYLHHCYHLTTQDPHLPIPLVENFLFSLALLRSRTVENIKEAKIILTQLLHFQNGGNEANEKGNFPIYLHEFPVCKDYYTGIHVSFIICWILKHFHHVLGHELKQRLENSLEKSVQYALHIYSEKKVPYPISIKIGAVAVAAGQLLANSQLSDRGFHILHLLKEHPDETAWYCPASLGNIAVSLLLVYPHLNESPWKFLWNHLQQTWHRATASYAGPSLKERQQGPEPQVTLYDLLCGYFSDCFSDRALKESFVHLEAVLIPSSEEKFQPLNYPFEIHGNLQGTKWWLYHDEQLAYSAIEHGHNTEDSAYVKGVHLFRLLWGNRHRVHTFVCQGGNTNAMEYSFPTMTFKLASRIDVEDREKNRELMFFFDAQEGLEFLVAGKKSSTFLLGDEITIKDNKIEIKLNFSLEEGEGRFLGHRMLGNRPAQLETKGENRFHAFDWQLFLRTISRSERCRVKMQIGITLQEEK